MKRLGASIVVLAGLALGPMLYGCAEVGGEPPAAGEEAVSRPAGSTEDESPARLPPAARPQLGSGRRAREVPAERRGFAGAGDARELYSMDAYATLGDGDGEFHGR